ncbi:MAG: helix-turn-helix domain-containing protein [Bacteroidia bacterium]
MEREAFNKLFQRYSRHCISIVDELVNAAADRRGFMLEYYSFQLTEAFNISRDSYRGHLVTLLRQGMKQNLPLSYILEEMELYRVELIHVLETESGIENLLTLFDRSVYEEGYKTKIHVVMEFMVKISITRYLRQIIKKNYPLALANDDTPEQPVIFNITDELFPELEKVKILNADQNAVTSKERRLDYPEEMNAEEAAEFLNTTLKNLYQMTSSHKVPHYKRGRKLIFKKSELENWGLERVTSREEQKTLSANHLLSKKKKK